MKAKLQTKLFEQFPWIKSVHGSRFAEDGFSCGDGWYQLLYDMFLEIEAAYAKSSGTENRSSVGQIKQKFGELRVYIYDVFPEVNDIISEKQKVSTSICEQCGKEGKLERRTGVFQTLCDECVESNPQYTMR
ncbi:hypothetical protein [Cohnella sp. AR92]|uniref:hypothetical protein n=1 Tax=Cohnella sp. AR92 TaxID=648716 RepID=UPI000F8C993D|nr:hypothetical protein [Cohnella sp. AR92]RUS44580.1 hypothetical protein ELR57_22620 [Cohnella sp. AR92]